MNDTIRNLERTLAHIPVSRPRERATNLYELAFALHRHDAQRAASAATEAYELATTAGETRLAARSMSVLAECRRITGNAAEALELIDRAGRIAQDLGDPRMQAQWLHQRGMILHSLGRSAEAADVLQQAIDVARTLENSDVLIGVHDVLGVVYQTLGLLAEALQQHLCALELLGGNITEAHASAHANIAALLLRLGQGQDAQAHYEKALEIYRTFGNSIGEAGVLMNMGICREEQKQWSEALALYDQALPLARSRPDHPLLPLLLGNIGTVYERTGEYAAALACLSEARALAQERPGELLAQVLRCLGTLHLSTGELHRAAEVLDQGMDIARNLGDAGLCALYHEEYVRLHEATGNPGEALRQYRLAAALREQIAGDQVHGRIQNLRIAYEMRRLQAEKELMRERAESLEQDVEIKSRELAAMALHLAHKQRSLARMKEELQGWSADEGTAGEPAQRIHDAIDLEIRSETEWDRFRRHFDAIHPDFISRLAQAYSDLTPTELRICSLLKLQLSSKDIADLLCISRHTVDTHRQRLRRKLGLASRTGLVAFLLAY